MNDDEMLTALRSSLVGTRESLGEVCFDRPVSAVVGKARGKRLQRGLSAGVAGGLALGMGLTLGLSGGGQAPSGGVHVNLDGFSVNTTSHGLVDVTISDLRNPAQLRAALAQAGIPAIVNVGKDCHAGPSLPQIRKVVLHDEQPRRAVWQVNPAAIPAGTELDFSVAHVAQAQPSHQTRVFGWASLYLIRDGAKLTCRPGL